MSRIIKLPEEIANRIAAGEVVERPASVVKELIENSLDSGANYVELFTDGGGVDSITVTDDGHGMTPEETMLAIQRHATSKLPNIDALFEITSYGFRGEALPSIASVSEFELVTRPHDSDKGYRIFIDHGELVQSDPVPAAKGTTITVRNLFGKVPARRRFLKSARAENSRIQDVLTKLAIAHPEIAFRYEASDFKEFYLDSASGYLHRIEQVFGEDHTAHLREIQYDAAEYMIYGYVGDENLHYGRGGNEFFYLNNRPIKSSLVGGAVKNAMKNYLPPRRYPAAYIFIDAPPDLVDVNVHPAKHEVRFRREQAVFVAVLKAVKAAISSSAFSDSQRDKIVMSSPEVVQQEKLNFPEPERQSPGVKLRDEAGFLESSATQSRPAPARRDREINDALESISRMEDFEDRAQGGRPQFLQILNTYIATPMKKSLILMDQHAAHERILYERILTSLEKQAMTGQRLLFPVELDLPPHWVSVAAELMEYFDKIGMEISIEAANHIRLISVPSFWRSSDYERLFKDILEELSEMKGDTPEIMRRFAASVSCKAAIKAGQRLSQDEMQNLFDSLFATDFPTRCPHGRPTIREFNQDMLEKMFGRT